MIVPAAIFAAVVAWLICAVVRSNAQKWHLVDVPNIRSSHLSPTPRGGGLGIVVGFFASLAVLVFTGDVDAASALALAPALPIAVLGFIDDRHSLGVRSRLLVQLLCSAIIVLLANPAIFEGGALSWITAAVLVAYVAWLINLYNFMDGIDGIAATQAMTVLIGVIVISWWQGGSIEHDGWLLMLAACGGFLLWNWAPARLFMGDVGSTFIGASLATWSLVTPSVPLAAWLILMAAFIGDASFILLRRAWRREPVWRAHRSHLYQQLARRWGSHARVCQVLVAVNLLWLGPLALLAAHLGGSPIQQSFIVFVAYLPIVVVAYNMT